MAITTKPESAPGSTAALIAGDTAALVIFAIVGRRSHGAAAGLGAALEVLLTAAPFIAGWLLVAPWLGAFRPAATAGPAAALRTTLIAWVVALPVGAILRALMVGRLSPPSFYIVTFFAVLLLLGGWRMAYAWGARRRA